MKQTSKQKMIKKPGQLHGAILYLLVALLALGNHAKAQLPTTLAVGGTHGGGNNSGNEQLLGTPYDISGNMYVVGVFTGEFNPDPTGNPANLLTLDILVSTAGSTGYVAKYSSTGAYIWSFPIPSAQAKAIAIDKNGYIYVGGSISAISTTPIDMDPSAGVGNIFSVTTTGNSGADMFVAKYDGNLTPSNLSFYQWAFIVGVGTGSLANDVLNSMFVDANGYLYIAGNLPAVATGGNTADMDPSSNVHNVTSAGTAGTDMVFAKYDAKLTPSSTSFYQWAFAVGTTSTETANAITVDAAGYVYIIGTLQKPGTGVNLDMDPSSATNNLTFTSTTAGNNDAVIAKYNGNLTPSSTSFYQWAFAIGSNATDAINGIAVDNSDGVYITGTLGANATATNIDMDPSTGVNNVALGLVANMVVAKYDGTKTPSSTSFYQWAFLVGGSAAGSPNGSGLAIAVDSNKNVYVSGLVTGTSSTTVDIDPSSNTNNVTGVSATSNADILVAKYDGTLTPASTSFYKWGFTLATTGTGDKINAVAVSSNRLYLAGVIGGYGMDIDPSANTFNLDGHDVGNLSFDMMGVIYDITQVPTSASFLKGGFATGSSASTAIIQSTATDASGNVYVCGSFSGTMLLDTGVNMKTLNTPLSSKDIYVAKYNATGGLMWGFNVGGNSDDRATGITVDGSGNIYVTGFITAATTDNIDMDPSSGVNNVTGATATSSGDVFVAKYDGNQTPTSTSFYKWAFTVGGTGTDLASSIAVDGAGIIYLSGSVTGTTSTSIDMDPSSGINNVTGASASSSTDVFVAKYDGTQTPASTSFYKWAFTAGGAGADQSNSITLDATGNVYVAGFLTGATATSIDMDPSSSTNNVTGASATSSSDIFVAKYDGTQTPSSTSFYKWAFTSGGAAADVANGVTVDASDNVYVAGYITGTTSTSIDMDPSSAAHNVTGATATSGLDILIAKYDGTQTPSSTSFYKWAFTAGDISNDAANGITVDTTGDIYVTGYFRSGTTGSVDMDPSSNTNVINGFSAATTGNSDIFVAKYDGTLTPSSTSFYKWAFSEGGVTSNDTAKCISFKNGQVVIGGQYTGANVDFQGGSNSFLASSGDNGVAPSAFMAMYADFCVKPVLSSTITNVTCNNDSNGSVVLTVTAGATPYTYSWTGPNGFTVASSNISALKAGDYKVTVTTAGGCSDTLHSIITQPAALTPIAAFTDSTTTVTQGQNNVPYAVPNDTTVTYNWSYTGTGAAITGTTDSVSVSYNATATSGTLSVTATNSCGISTARTLAITVNPTSAVYYSAATGNLDATATWNTNMSGTGGSSPSSFTAAGQTFHIANGNTGAFGADWTVSGAGSKVIAGNDFNITGHNVTANVTMGTGTALAIGSGSTLTTNDSLVLMPGARIGAIAGTISGNVIVETRFNAQRGYRILSHPFTANIDMATLNNFIDITGIPGVTSNCSGATASAYNYVPGSGWVGITTNTGMFPAASAGNTTHGNGILLFVRGAKGQGCSGLYTGDPITADTLVTSGTVNIGSTTLQETVPHKTGAAIGDGWNLVSNPLPSQIDASMIGTSSGAIDDDIILENPAGQSGGSATTNGTMYQTVSVSSAIIPMNSGFLAHNSSSTADAVLNFPESAKTAASTTFNVFKTTSLYPTLEYSVMKDTAMWDNWQLRFKPLAAKNAGDEGDITKLSNTFLNFYSISANNVQLNRDARDADSLADGEIIPLGFQTSIQAAYQLVVTQYSLPANKTVYLHDKYTNSYVQAGNGVSYPVTISADTASQAAGRLELIVNNAITGIAGVVGGTQDITIVPNPATASITINYSGAYTGPKDISIINVLGQVVKQLHTGEAMITVPVSDLASGVYLVRTNRNGNSFTQRFIKN